METDESYKKKMKRNEGCEKDFTIRGEEERRGEREREGRKEERRRDV